MIEGLSEGRIVHFVLPDGPHNGDHRPAIVVKVWDRETGCVNLQVFMDGLNDNHGGGTRWETSVLPDEEEKEPRTWHFPERV